MKPGLLISLVVLAFWTDFLEAQLSENFYANKCPNVESIVRGAVNQKFSQTFVTIPGTLRLFFHDCLVEGCDGSVIIASTSDNKAEKDFEDNQSLAGDGFDTVIKAKQAVEKVCPNTVSCADILALATRDVIRLAGGPSYKVELGRRDGRISKASRCQGNIPKPTFNVNQLMSVFSKRGLSLVDMVALSGAHTLGFSHCDKFQGRIFPKLDSSLNAEYAQQLRQQCPRNVDPTIAIFMDPTTPRKFDNVYYTNLQQGKGLFSSDQILFADPRTRGIVNKFASDATAFNEAFVEAMRKLGRVGVKTGNQGEIHTDCSRIN